MITEKEYNEFKEVVKKVANNEKFKKMKNLGVSLLMFAGILADTIISSVKAPKGEHLSTFTDRTFNDFSYAFSMPLGVITNASAPMGISKAVYVTSRPTKRKTVHAMHAQLGTLPGIPRKKRSITADTNQGAIRILGRICPSFVLVLSTRMPIIGSLIASKIPQ